MLSHANLLAAGRFIATGHEIDESVADVRLRAEIAREVEEICDARGKRAREEPALRARLARAGFRARVREPLYLKR